MSAILTTTSLTVLDHSSLKHLPPAAQPARSLTSAPSSIVWCAENGTIFLSYVDGTISRYDISTELIQDISLAIPSSEPAVSLLYKDRGNTIIYGQGQRAIVLSVGTGKPANIFDTHKAPVTSLSLSNDSSLLASTSAHAIHIHNLTLASHTILRGIPAGTGSITTCAFHPHSRTRLLVGLGSQLLVYDTTRPSGPAKAVEIDKDKKNTGPIVAISCSPFSKTLVAVACSGGTVALVDLEKEKGLFRVVSMPAPITCLSFSAEGAALYAGTENGKFLLLDLRTLDKPPKTVTLSTNGDRVVALAVQRKLKPGEAQAKPAASASSAPKPLVQRDVNKATASRSTSATTLGKKLPEKDAGKVALRTTRPRAATGTTNGTGTTTSPRRPVVRTATAYSQANAPASRVTSGSRPNARTAPKSPTSTRAPATEAPMKAFSPPRSPVALPEKGDENQSGDLSVRIENLLAMPKAKEHVVPATIDEAPPTAAPSRAASVLSRASSRSQISEGARARARARAESASHAPTSESISTAGSHVRSGSSASTTGRASKASVRSALGASSVSPVHGQPRRVSGSTISRSRTPSPELPDINDGGPVTPIPSYKMKGKDRAAAGVLGLGTPEVDEWIKAGEAKETRKEGKRVGFASDSEDDADGADNVPRPRSAARSRLSDESEDDGPVLEPSGGRSGQQRARPEFAMQVSPRRSFPGPGSGASGASRWAPVPSPLRNPAPPGPGPASPQARAAQDMLQALLRDALHDFRTETKAEIVGLHLDMIRMGSSWRREMQDAVGGLGEELRALREENARLREENERLRRGY
ncbi:WD40-repeat-containing domain protein [Trametes elegans]|nr:WD40-repeat-containing domain protein [Trametes elegans]